MIPEEYKYYREEERYEVGLAKDRVSFLLNSQSLLFAGWAIILAKNDAWHPKSLLFVISVLALVTCWLSFLSLNASVAVIKRWQQHGYCLMRKLKQQNRIDPTMLNFHLNREPGDMLHKLGVSWFSLIVPVSFMVMWGFLLAYSINPEFFGKPPQNTPAANCRSQTDQLKHGSRN